MTIQNVGCDPWRRTVSAHGRSAASATPTGLRMCRLAADGHTCRQLFLDAHILLCIDGSAELRSYAGRETMARGTLVIRPSVDTRSLRAGPGGLTWLELPWPTDFSRGSILQGVDVDRLLLVAAHDPGAAQTEVAGLVENATAANSVRALWPDRLAAAMLHDPHLSISQWARSAGISRESAARGFAAAYDVTPVRFRLEVRARMAWVRIMSTADPLSAIALEAGFADQSHMTRTVGWLTGRSPAAWRRMR